MHYILCQKILQLYSKIRCKATKKGFSNLRSLELSGDPPGNRTPNLLIKRMALLQREKPLFTSTQPFLTSISFISHYLILKVFKY